MSLWWSFRDLILHRLSEASPNQVVRAVVVGAVVMGMIASFIWPFLFHVFERFLFVERNQTEQFVELRRKYEAVCAENVELRGERDQLARDNKELRRLQSERITGDKYWDSRSMAALRGRKQ